jgi:hypothetical protein
VRRYWNGHQWRELPESTGDDQPRSNPVPAAQAVAQEAPMTSGETEEAPTTSRETEEAPTAPGETEEAPMTMTSGETEEAPKTPGAIMVATHAEYGDVFTAVAASSSAETEHP